MKQLATIIEEYEKNPRPSVTRLEELQKVLNQDDHSDEYAASTLGVTKQQIKTWFSNRRAKERLDLIKMKIKETRVGLQGSSGSDSDGHDETEMAVAGQGNAVDGGKRTLVVKDDGPNEAEDMKVDG
eukprot:jgi/Phyca11/506296/fgenesh2_kg.PHYCAscaffold_19_\